MQELVALTAEGQKVSEIIAAAGAARLQVMDFEKARAPASLA